MNHCTAAQNVEHNTEMVIEVIYQCKWMFKVVSLGHNL